MVSLLVLSSLAAGTARARDVRVEAAASPRAQLGVLIVEDPSTDWGRRVQGQLSDLPASAEIQAAPTLAAPASPGRALPAPAAAAGSEKASSRALTAWLVTGSDPASHESDGTFIAIWFAGAAKPYTRRIAADWATLSAGDRSAALELAALSVRSAVRSLLLDRTAENAPSTRSTTPASAGAADAKAALGGASRGTAVAAAAATPARATVAPAMPEEETSPPAALEERAAGPADARRETNEAGPARADSASPLRLALELGAAWQFYGRTALGAPGMRGGVQLLIGAWGFELIGQYGWPVSARVAPASFDLQRHAALAELSFAAADFGTWRFCPLLRAGLTWLRRDGTRTDDADLPLQASRAESYRSPFVGAGAIAEQRLSATLSLSLRGVLNVETAIPTFTLVDTTGARVSSGSPWSIQPSLEIGAHWRW
jgi:hypothetical protein